MSYLILAVLLKQYLLPNEVKLCINQFLLSFESGIFLPLKVTFCLSLSPDKHSVIDIGNSSNFKDPTRDFEIEFKLQNL